MTATDVNAFPSNAQQYTVTIGSAVLQSVTLVCGTTPATVPIGGTVTCVTTGHFSDGSTQTLTSGVTYSTGDPNIATVDATTGAVTGKAAGTATITATYPGLPAVQLTITSHPPTVTGLQPPPATANRPVGASGNATTAPAPTGRTGTSGGSSPPPAPTGRP